MRLARETGKPIARVARDLGINDGTLGNWVNADRRRRDGGDGRLSEVEPGQSSCGSGGRTRSCRCDAMCSSAARPLGFHQLQEDLVAAGRPAEPQHPVGVLTGVQQDAHPRRRARQRPGRPRARAEVELKLADGHPLPGRGLQRLQLGLIVSRTDVLDAPRTAA